MKNSTVTMNPGVYILDAQGSSGTGLNVKHTTLTDNGAGVDAGVHLLYLLEVSIGRPK